MFDEEKFWTDRFYSLQIFECLAKGHPIELKSGHKTEWSYKENADRWKNKNHVLAECERCGGFGHMMYRK